MLQAREDVGLDFEVPQDIRAGEGAAPFSSDVETRRLTGASTFRWSIELREHVQEGHHEIPASHAR
jgi:hypothetical protein